MVLLLVFASEDSLQFFIPAKHLNHIELAILVSECVGAFTQQLIDLIKSFIIYLSPPFCHIIKKIEKIQMNKTEHMEEEDDFIKVQPPDTEVQDDKFRCTETKQMQRKERNNIDSI